MDWGENKMIRPILIGGSIGLIVGVLLGTVGGSSHPFEVILQMIFCSFGGAMLGACCGFLTRKKGANETFLPSHQPLSENSSNYNLLTWAATIIALIAAIIKGFMLGSQLGQ